MMNQDKLLNALHKKGLLKFDQFNSIIESTKTDKKNIESILEKIVDPEEIAKTKAEFYDMPYIDLTDYQVTPKTLAIIPVEVAQNYKIISFNRKKDSLEVGVVDPDNFKAIEAVDFLTKEIKIKPKYYLISQNGFDTALKQYKSMSKELDTALKSRAKDEQELVAVDEKNKPDIDEKEVTKSAPVSRIASVIIRHAVEGKASDIHIEPLKNETRVRYRIDGIMHTSLVLPKSVHKSLIARIKVMANLKLDETRIPQDGRIRLIINEKEIDFRVSILPLVGFEKVVMRILDTTKGAPSIDDLGFQGQQRKILMAKIKQTEGLFLVTGPTGSGKSTTLMAILSILNVEGINISTLEDPVEYKIEGVSQSQIFPTLGYTFASGLRSFLRQDPDIIMVGEIRDTETAELSIHSALTGHFVLSTLHTVDCPTVITRLVDMDVEPFLIGSTLNAVIAQRLARKICEQCKEKTEVPKKYLDHVKEELDILGEEYVKSVFKDYNKDKIEFHKGKGCPHCSNSGYYGRVAVAEVLDVNKKIKKLIIEGKKYLTTEDISETQLFITIRQDGILKIIQGVTTMEEILRIMSD